MLLDSQLPEINCHKRDNFGTVIAGLFAFPFQLASVIHMLYKVLSETKQCISAAVAPWEGVVLLGVLVMRSKTLWIISLILRDFVNVLNILSLVLKPQIKLCLLLCPSSHAHLENPFSTALWSCKQKINAWSQASWEGVMFTSPLIHHVQQWLNVGLHVSHSTLVKISVHWLYVPCAAPTNKMSSRNLQCYAVKIMKETTQYTSVCKS